MATCPRIRVRNEYVPTQEEIDAITDKFKICPASKGYAKDDLTGVGEYCMVCGKYIPLGQWLCAPPSNCYSGYSCLACRVTKTPYVP